MQQIVNRTKQEKQQLREKEHEKDVDYKRREKLAVEKHTKQK